VRQAYADNRGVDYASSLTPDEAVDRLIIAGNAEQCVERLRELFSVAVQHQFSEIVIGVPLVLMYRKSSIYGEKKSCPRSAKHEPNAALADNLDDRRAVSLITGVREHAGSFRSRFDSINPRGRVVKQRRALGGGIFFCDQLKCVSRGCHSYSKVFPPENCFRTCSERRRIFQYTTRSKVSQLARALPMKA